MVVLQRCEAHLGVVLFGLPNWGSGHCVCQVLTVAMRTKLPFLFFNSSSALRVSRPQRKEPSADSVFCCNAAAGRGGCQSRPSMSEFPGMHEIGFIRKSDPSLWHWNRFIGWVRGESYPLDVAGSAMDSESPLTAKRWNTKPWEFSGQGETPYRRW